MPFTHERLSLQLRALCCLLSYTLVATFVALPERSVEAVASASRGSGKAARASLGAQAQADAPRRDGELIVRFRADLSEQGREDVARSHGARRRGRLRGESGAERLELGNGQDPAAVAEQLRARPEVELAEPNFLVRRDEMTPNDPRFAEQWALRNTGQTGGAVGSDIRAAGAWQETTGAASTVIAVIDSGIDFTHPDLRNNAWTNAGEVSGNNRDDDRDGYVDDVNGWDWVTESGAVADAAGHGTAVAGIIAAEGDNAEGIAGVMWRASLMSLRVLDASGTGDVASAVESIDYAAAHGASVINCSWGTDAGSQLLREAIERAGRRGVVVVTSAGNSGRDIDAEPYYPASYGLPNLIAVAASDASDNLTEFSNRGAASVAVAAPGAAILTTQVGGGYSSVTGTSASAPLVAGIAGLVKTLRPNATAASVRAAIAGGARRADALAGKVSSGGVADAEGALAVLHGNPYPSGNGASGSAGDNGQGGGNGQPYVPPALRHDNDHGRANGHSGLVVDPPAVSKGAPGEHLPNLDRSRRVRSSPANAAASGTIQANLMCATCDASGGGGAGGSDPYFGTARKLKANETGQPGVTLGSSNYNWSLPIVALPGRAGLDLSLVLSYNSLVWTKQGSSIEYNADHGTPAPGFQLGFPRLQAQFTDADTGTAAYTMITPAGGRVEMRQTATAGVYEAADGSYAQLTFTGTTPVVRTTDGTQYRFEQQAGAEWRCTLVEDRNGNYIGIAYYADGRLNYLYDTLLRRIDFNYYADGNLQSVTQAWGATTHTYATFTYASVQMSVSFPGLAVYGLPAGGSQTVLSSVALSTGGSYQFDYNSYGQVYRLRRNAPDGHELQHTRYNLSDADLAGAPQTDCPRFTARYDYAQDWSSNQEVSTSYSVTKAVTWQNPETQAQESGTLSQETAPDGTLYKEYSHAAGWDAGLTRLSEVWANVNGVLVRKKYTSVSWTEDDSPPQYAKNPRILETNVYDDAGHHRRTTFEYGVGYSLPTAVREYGGLAGDIYLRGTFTGYRLDAGYLNVRLIGLIDNVNVYDGQSGALVSKVVYQYDLGDEFRQYQGNSLQHDAAYDAGFQWRGNCWSVLRFNADAPNDWNQISEARTGYNTDGSVIFITDPLGHRTTLDYADNFSDGNNSRGVHAYPTTNTDPDNGASTTQYIYDFGAVTLTHTPTSGTGTGVTYADVATQYDASGRIQQETNQTSGAYRRFVYETNDNYVHSYQTITGTTTAHEFHSWQVLDGAGRVRATAADHPGSGGGYSGQYVVYDNMGRVSQQSNPTEMTGGWVPANWTLAGDDAAWFFTTQTYDYKGRPRQTTHPDGSTQVLDYGGCGCAGGDVTTSQDEHGRQQRYTKDTLGRLVKVEELNWDGSVYSTTAYSYNARDQLTRINQQGQTPRSFDYDGHGRLISRTTPEQGTTAYAYNADDTLSSTTDARGAKATYTYNARHLVTSVQYDLSGVLAGQSVAATSNVSYSYDAAGNRTQMTDGQGSVAYHYDNLSRMDWEERTFTGVGTYRLSYGYNPGGELTSLTNPWGAQVSYSYDTAGRLAAVNGANYAGVSTYASGITYRAFGAVKGINYADGHALSTSYDNLMRPTKWMVSGVLGYKYYYGDFGEKTGKVTFAQQINDANADLDRTQTAGSLDRSFEYDQVGRLIISHTGAEARAHAFTGQWGTMDGPYSQGYDYDVSGNLTHRYGWGGEVQGGSAGQSSDHYYTYTNNRRTDSGFTYDNSGNLTFDGGQHFSYDAAGGQTSSDWTNLQQGYDGDGLRVSRSEDGLLPTRYLRSSVLGGQVVAEIGWASVSWQWARGYVYAGSQLLAVQQNGVYLVHEDAVTKAKRVTSLSGAVQSAVEVDPYGGQTSVSSNAAFQPRQFTTYERDANGTDEAMARRYNRWHARFDQPDPYSGSYDLSDPQSFNRYSYTGNDPVNFTDPTGLLRLVEPVRQLDGPAFWYLWDASNSGWEPPLDWGRGERPIREPREPQNPAVLQKPPCPSVPEAPPGVSVDENIKVAERHRPVGIVTAIYGAKWFKSMVNHKAPWDYKRIDMKYEDFGNFNYGATGAAIGFDLVTLHSEAGRVQAIPPGMKEKPEEWGYPAGRLWGEGKYPYGDEPKDAEQVKAGFNYYVRKFVKKDCQ